MRFLKNFFGSVKKTESPAGGTVLGTLLQAKEAIDTENVVTLESLLRKHPSLGEELDDLGWSLLHYAVAHYKLQSIARMLSCGLNVNISTKNGNCTPLFFACAGNGPIEMAQLLIEHGADVNWRDEEGGTALHAAANHNRTDLITLLIAKGSEVNVKRKADGWTPLHCADNLETVKLLIEKGANSAARDRCRRTRMDIARGAKQNDIAEFLQRL